MKQGQQTLNLGDDVLQHKWKGSLLIWLFGLELGNIENSTTKYKKKTIDLDFHDQSKFWCISCKLCKKFWFATLMHIGFWNQNVGEKEQVCIWVLKQNMGFQNKTRVSIEKEEAGF